MDFSINLDYKGESLVTTPRKEALNGPLDICLQFFGHEITGKHYHIVRKNFLSYMFTYMKRGNMELLFDQKVYHLKDGEVAFINCMQPHEAWVSSPEGMEIYFIHFYAPFLSDFYEKITTCNHIFAFPNEKKMTDLYAEMTQMIGDGKEYDVSLLSKLIYAFLLDFQKDNKTIKNDKDLPPYLDEAIVYVSKHYKESLNRESLAKSVNISSSYLEALFRKNLHMGIGAYIATYRYQRAAELLRFSDFRVKDIAASVGLSVQSLIRIFIQKNKITPSDYRKRNC